MTGALPSDTVKNPKLSTYLVLSARSYPTEDPQCSTHVHGSINTVTICPKQPNEPQNDKLEEEEEKDNPENIHVNPSTPPDPSVSFITKKSSNSIHFSNRSDWFPNHPTPNVCTKREMTTWMAFGGNTRDLGSFGEETNEITDLYQILEEVLLTARGDGVAGLKRCRRDPSGSGVRDLVTASGRGRLNEDLKSST
ncbi:hypothetical protein Tco_1455875 [Tanacetum coccineum]